MKRIKFRRAPRIKPLAMKAIRVSLLVGTTLLLGRSNILNAQSVEQQIDEIFAMYDDISKPGASVAVVRNGQIIFRKGYGAANLEYDIPIGPETIFQVASVSKQFTVFSLLLLADENKLSLDDNVQKYIPEFPNFGSNITLRHLASHTSGLRDQWALLALAGWRFDDVITREHILELVSQQKELNFKPGEQYLYSNTGFTLLAEVVARVSGKSFPEFTRQRIFEPLKMANTHFSDDHERMIKDRAYSYYPTRNGFKKNIMSFANVGATSLFTTVEDVSLWAMNFQSPIVGSHKLIEEMNTPAVLNNGNTFTGALGQFVDTYKGLNQIQHGGSNNGYRSYLARFPDHDLAVITLSNTSAFNYRSAASRVVDIFLKEYQSSPEPKRPKNYNYKSLTPMAMERFAGHYWSRDEYYSRQIYIRNDTMRYSRNGTSESDLMPISDNKFKMINVRADLIIEFKGEGHDQDMNIVVDDGPPSYFDLYEPANYSADDLIEFTGDFYSEELSATYQVKLLNGQLIANHLRAGNIAFNPIMKDLFLGDHRYFHHIKIVRDNNQQIKGLRVSGYRTKNFWFEKVK